MRKLSLVAGLIAVAVMVGAIFVAGEAFSQSSKSKKGPVESREVEVRLSVFSGNELRLGSYWLVEADCTSQVADVRVARKPANGEIVLKETRTVVEVKKDTPRAHCNGTSINSIGAFYTSREDFTGQERMAVDVDYKAGIVRRVNYIVTVR